MVTPVFICTGFLDSGKTTLIKDTLMEQEWIEPGLTLLIVCEEGEEAPYTIFCATPFLPSNIMLLTSFVTTLLL